MADFSIIWIDALDATRVVLGPGPVTNVMDAEVVQELDKAGTVTVTVPATDERAISLLTAGRRFRVMTAADGCVGEATITNIERAGSASQATMKISGPDMLDDLRRLSCGYSRIYSDMVVDLNIIGSDTTAGSLLYGTGWTPGTVTVDPTATPDTLTADGVSRLEALIQLAEQSGHHLRQTYAATPVRQLDYGLFGADSGYTAMNVDHVTPDLAGNPSVMFIDALTGSEVSTDVENLIMPLGKDKFDLRDAPLTITDIYVRTNGGPGVNSAQTTTDDATSGALVPVASTAEFAVNETIWIGDASDWTQTHECGVIASIDLGVSLTLHDPLSTVYAAGADVIQRPQFYVQDTVSQAAYGVCEALPQFPWIGATEQGISSADQQKFAYTLYRAAKARLERFAYAYETYALGSVYNVPRDLQAGDKIRVRFSGGSAPYSTAAANWLSVNGLFYVLKITRKWAANGARAASIDIANVARPSPVNQNLVLYNLDVFKWIGLGSN